MALRARLTVSCVAGLLAALAISGVAAGSASAAKVLLQNKGANGVAGEKVWTYGYVEFGSEATCEAEEEEEETATLGKNPSGKAKFLTPDTEVPSSCETSGGAVAKGTWFNKSISIGSNGSFSWKGIVTVETAGECKYELKKLGGTLTFPTLTESGALSGTAKLQKKVTNPASCAKSVPVTGYLAVGAVSNFEVYEASIAT